MMNVGDYKHGKRHVWEFKRGNFMNGIDQLYFLTYIVINPLYLVTIQNFLNSVTHFLIQKNSSKAAKQFLPSHIEIR